MGLLAHSHADSSHLGDREKGDGENRPAARRKAAALAIAASIIVGGAAGGWILTQNHGVKGAAPLIRADGPTLYQALAALNGSVEGTAGGPWSLFSVFGIAAQAH